MKKDRVIIHIEDGLVQQVYSNNKNIEVEIYDLDENNSISHRKQLEHDLEFVTRKMKVIA